MTSALRPLFALLGPPRARLVLSIALGSLAVGFGVALLTTAGYLISRAAEHPPILELTTVIVAVRFFALARPLARYLERLASHDAALRGLGGVRARVYGRIEPLAPAGLEEFRRGDLLTRLVADVDALQNLTLRALSPAVVALVVGLACVATCALVLPWAAGALAVGLVLAGVAVPLLARVAGRAAARQAPARGELTAELVELLRGAPELVAYGREEDALARVRRADRELVGLARRDAFVAGLADGAFVLVVGATTAVVLALAVSAHEAGALDRVLVATLALLALSSFDAVQPLPAAARDLVSTVASGRRVLELTRKEPAVRDRLEPARLSGRRPVVALEGVSARYGDGPPVLDGLDLRLEPGARVALVGPSGAGKTTVTSLLLRFLDPSEGRVSLDGRDIRELAQEDVRRTFALAGQEAHVFDSTIRENLRLARPDATDEELGEALRLARLDEWVASLPAGLDTLVGEEGARLSGGQRQRLVIARALLVDAPVLLLDEPTAHLDTATAGELVRDVFAAAGDSQRAADHAPIRGARPRRRGRDARARLALVLAAVPAHVDPAAVRAREHGDENTAERSRFSCLVPRRRVDELVGLVVHLGAAARARMFHEGTPTVTCSRPWRSVSAIHRSSSRNFSIRGRNVSSSSAPSSSKRLCTDVKLTSQKIVTSPSSRRTGTRFWIIRAPPKTPAETPTIPAALWMYSGRFVSSTCFSRPG